MQIPPAFMSLAPLIPPCCPVRESHPGHDCKMHRTGQSYRGQQFYYHTSYRTEAHTSIACRLKHMTYLKPYNTRDRRPIIITDSGQFNWITPEPPPPKGPFPISGSGLLTLPCRCFIVQRFVAGLIQGINKWPIKYPLDVAAAPVEDTQPLSSFC